MNATAPPRRRRLLRTLVMTALLFSAISQSPALALDRDHAVTYANNNWNKRPSNFPSFGTDCTNFISQALYAGGVHMRWPSFGWTGAYATQTYWAAQHNTITNWTTSWSVAQTSANWVTGTFPNSSITAVPAKTYQSQPPAGYRHKSDLVYYDWTGNGSIDHVSIITVKSGTDSNSGYSGTLVNQHTTDRKKAIWHLRPYNSNWAKTVYYPVYVPNGAS